MIKIPLTNSTFKSEIPSIVYVVVVIAVDVMNNVVFVFGVSDAVK